MKNRLKRIVPRRLWVVLRNLEVRIRFGIYRAFVGMVQYAPDGNEALMTVLWERFALTPELIIRGTAVGLIPAPEHAGPMRWHDPDERSVLLLSEFHIPKRMRSYLNQRKFEVRFDTNFRGVIEGCAAPAPGRETTWITPELQSVFMELHRRGVAHSVETYQDGELVGGIYGVALGGMFAISSMFYRVDNSSKVAMVYLATMLRQNGFMLMDAGWLLPHFSLFGAVEIPRQEFKDQLARALTLPAVFRASTEEITIDYQQFS